MYEQIRYVQKPSSTAAIVLLLGIAVTGVFSVGLDQGQLFGLVYGDKHFDPLYIHEFAHDLMHSAGFPCH